ncbi:hypothetical protein [Streptomyces sp. Wb2n-11]|uniref:hypothetical protein n=1 Tax=Streptomyces sp. Wb2n-11 TaxID=1030533 RepID=UPI000B1EF068|nr:hypothetical protein [Streptomyces sp. Wb2n-11]
MRPCALREQPTPMRSHSGEPSHKACTENWISEHPTEARLIEIIRNLRERITEARANGWLGEVEGLQVSLNAAMAKLTSLNRTPTDGRPQLVDLGMPIFNDTPSP